METRRANRMNTATTNAEQIGTFFILKFMVFMIIFSKPKGIGNPSERCLGRDSNNKSTTIEK